MGGVLSGGDGAKQKYDKLTEHRQQLYKRQTDYLQQAEKLKRQAAMQLQNGNKEGAISLGRQYKTATNQATIVGGIICNLDAQRASMETKELTEETVKVLSSCVKHMGTKLSVEKIESTLDKSDDAQADLKEITDLLSCPVAGGGGQVDDEDDILSMINGSIETVPQKNYTAKAPAEMLGKHDSLAPPPLYYNEDEAFLTWARLQLADSPPSIETLLPDTSSFQSIPPNSSNPNNHNPKKFAM